MIRAILFQAVYWLTSIFFSVLSVFLLPWPSRRPMVAWIGLYTRLMTVWMRTVAGIRVEVEGRAHVPDGPCIIASKHQSWGDGFVLFSAVDDLAFVTGDHLVRYPLLGGILRKLGAIIVDNCGGATARARLVDAELKVAQLQNRRILIFPEGHLSPAGKRHRYRRGVFHMYAAYGCPVVPVATNLGLFWAQQDWRMKRGAATVAFLPPIPPGLEKEAFMARLEEAIETRSLELLGPARAILEQVTPLPDPERGAHAHAEARRA